MFRSKNLAEHIVKARKEVGQGEIMSLKDVEEKLNL